MSYAGTSRPERADSSLFETCIHGANKGKSLFERRDGRISRSHLEGDISLISGLGESSGRAGVVARRIRKTRKVRFTGVKVSKDIGRGQNGSSRVFVRQMHTGAVEM